MQAGVFRLNLYFELFLFIYSYIVYLFAFPLRPAALKLKGFLTGGFTNGEPPLLSRAPVIGVTLSHRIQAPLVIKINSFIQVWCKMPWTVVSTLRLLVVADRDVTVMQARFM